VTKANVFVTEASAAIAGNAENAVAQWIECKPVRPGVYALAMGLIPWPGLGIRLSESAPFVMPF
jgi:hypothetical protein